MAVGEAAAEDDDERTTTARTLERRGLAENEAGRRRRRAVNGRSANERKGQKKDHILCVRWAAPAPLVVVAV